MKPCGPVDVDPVTPRGSGVVEVRLGPRVRHVANAIVNSDPNREMGGEQTPAAKIAKSCKDGGFEVLRIAGS